MFSSSSLFNETQTCHFGDIKLKFQFDVQTDKLPNEALNIMKIVHDSHKIIPVGVECMSIKCLSSPNFQ